MPHFITDLCIGCGVCEIKCPTNTIWGAAKGQFYIHPERCIDCSVCGIYCPVDAIQNQHGTFIPRVKPKDIPKAQTATADVREPDRRPDSSHPDSGQYRGMEGVAHLSGDLDFRPACGLWPRDGD